MALKVLKQQAETPVGGNNRPFPKGVYKFEILAPTGSRTRPTPDFMHNADSAGDKLPRMAGDDGAILAVWLGKAQSLAAGQQDAGNQILFVDFIVRDGDTDINDLDVENPGEVGWQILRDARLLVNLAIALGATTDVVEGGETYVVPADNFVDLLKEGAFDGQYVVADIGHRNWTSKAGKSGTEVFVSKFVAAE